MNELKTKWESVKQALDKYYLGNGAGEPGHIYLLKKANGEKVAIRDETIFKLAAGEKPFLVEGEDGIWLLSDEFHRYRSPDDDWNLKRHPILIKYEKSYPAIGSEDWEEWIEATRAELPHNEELNKRSRQWSREYRAWYQQAAKDVEAGLIPYLVQNESGEWEMRQMARAKPTENNLL